ncbi:hypothetical protein NYO99_15840 [Pelomonas sp. UHG3]|uniref:Uncharacterized protein n=1 Tax=Roseateles hydrophilus TaxID=2975054 RepID=A0ACC6CDF3_9BURK|nr:hypothetical protein [Pelomonas sp. UHG3]MCY4746455.1 hypothetical protein [Pelomonas sp. UHG3]
MQTTTISTRTAALLHRMPRWFTAQAVDAARVGRERQARADGNRELEFLCGVEVVESDFGEWLDTVATFSQR